MSLPEEVRDALDGWGPTTYEPAAALEHLHASGLILFASELRTPSEELVERAADAYLVHELVVNHDALRAALSALVDPAIREGETR